MTQEYRGCSSLLTPQLRSVNGLARVSGNPRRNASGRGAGPIGRREPINLVAPPILQKVKTMEYALLVVFVIAIGVNFFLWFTMFDKLEIMKLKSKIRSNKFWLKHQKKVIKDLEKLVFDMKVEIKNLNSTLDALEEGVIEESDDDDEYEDDEEDDFDAIDAAPFDPKVN